MKLTLREWQSYSFPRHEIIYNASEHVDINDGYVPFTIGVSYLYENIKPQPRDRLVMCAINSSTDITRRGSSALNRTSILTTLNRSGIHNIYFPPRHYFDTISSYKFVISPEGNGIDCHRHYEALLAGCIPVVEEHPWIREKYEGCPMLYTRDYTEITHDYLDSIYLSMIDKQYDFTKLFLSSYPLDVQAQIKDNGTYWGKRLLGCSWY
jgi:hypothetical protein